jgi:hypothetical protein
MSEERLLREQTRITKLAGEPKSECQTHRKDILSFCKAYKDSSFVVTFGSGNSRKKVVFTAWHESVKAANIQSEAF